MKKKSTAQFAFFNLRVLIGLFLAVPGVSLLPLNEFAAGTAPKGCGFLVGSGLTCGWPMNSWSAQLASNTVQYTFAISQPAANDFALFETHNPWGHTFIKDAITSNGHTYTEFTPADLATVNFSDYRVVILNWDDTFLNEFITPYTAAIPALEAYAGAGGVVWVQAAIQGNPGNNFPMPFGGRGLGADFSASDNVIDPASPMMHNIPNPMQGGGVLHNSASHVSYTGLPGPAHTVVINPNDNQTVLYDLQAPTSSMLGNISTRSFVQTGDNVMIGGFIVQGTGPKRVIIRAIGPELTRFGVPNVLANPTLELHNGAGAVIASNDNWQTTMIGSIITQNQVQEILNSGRAPTDPRESAIIANLPAGNYTAIVNGVNNTTGVALVEVYDLAPETSSILGNISTRSFVQTADNVMIGGFIVQGTGPKRVIIRAIGPELTRFGVPNVLANPTLELHNGAGAVIASNDNWQTTMIGSIITQNQVQEILNSGRAPTDPRESAIIANLPAGNYTAIVRGISNTTGVALVEVYDLQ